MKPIYFITVILILIISSISEAQISGKYGPIYANQIRNLWKDNNSGVISSPGGILSPNTLSRLGNDGVSKCMLFYKWNITDDLIPDGSTINSARLKMQGSYGNSTSYIWGFFSNIEMDLTNPGLTVLWDRCFETSRAIGTVDSDNNYYIDITFTSGSQFCNAISSSLSSNYFTLGVGERRMLLNQLYWNINNQVTLEINFTYPPVNTTVDQKLSTNVSTGTVGRWETNLFQLYNAPHLFIFSVGKIEILKASQEIISGEKYNNWNSLPDVINHHIFDITPTTTRFTSNLLSTHTGITIRNELIDAPSQNFGSIQFKDPWL
ncbi:MAG: hypothetical protein QME52_14380, partial [Bacteroidota bacterium]|nr:hypothetical protein [Bacteroidota bacterium]